MYCKLISQSLKGNCYLGDLGTSGRKNDSVNLMSVIDWVFSKRKFVTMPTYEHRNKDYFYIKFGSESVSVFYLTIYPRIVNVLIFLDVTLCKPVADYTASYPGR
jgi:hypothetical protein